MDNIVHIKDYLKNKNSLLNKSLKLDQSEIIQSTAARTLEHYLKINGIRNCKVLYQNHHYVLIFNVNIFQYLKTMLFYKKRFRTALLTFIRALDANGSYIHFRRRFPISDREIASIQNDIKKEETRLLGLL